MFSNEKHTKTQKQQQSIKYSWFQFHKIMRRLKKYLVFCILYYEQMTMKIVWRKLESE